MSENEKVEYGRHIVQAPTSYSVCTGCASCEMLCSLVHDGAVSPSYRRIYMNPGPTTTMIHTLRTCQHCSDHPCYNACPKKDKAMCIDETGIVYVKEEECIGCGLCAKACRYSPSLINIVESADKSKRKAKKCDLCRTRPEGPACVEWCQAKCLAVTGEPLPWEAEEKGE